MAGSHVIVNVPEGLLHYITEKSSHVVVLLVSSFM
jgi:hypothetical protein